MATGIGEWDVLVIIKGTYSPYDSDYEYEYELRRRQSTDQAHPVVCVAECRLARLDRSIALRYLK